MRLHKTRIALVLGLAAFFLPARAQYITQLGLSNYGPVHSLYVNPSFSAYTPYSWQINLAGLWANANNNYLTLRLPYSAYRIPNNIPAQYQSESGNPVFSNLWLYERLNGRNKNASVASSVYGPSATFKIKSWSVGLLTSAHADIRASHVPENLAHAIYRGFDSAQGAFSLFNPISQGGSNSIGEFTVNANSRITAGINVAKAIKLGWNRQLLVGATVKKVWGMPGFYLHNSGLVVNTVNQDSLVFQPGNIMLVSYGNQVGKGWGTDIGATYIFNKKDFRRNGNYASTRTKYFCKLGFAIMDIGRIKYTDATFNEVAITQPTGFRIDQSYKGSVAGNSNYQALADSFLGKFVTYQQHTGNFYVGLPTRLVGSADFQVRKNFFIGTVVTQSLRRNLSQNSRYQSFAMVSPRWEYKFFEFSLPMMLQYDYRSFRMGASARIGPLYVGTNSLASFLYTRGVRDADIFIGIAFSNLSGFGFKKMARDKRMRNAKGREGCGIF